MTFRFRVLAALTVGGVVTAAVSLSVFFAVQSAILSDANDDFYVKLRPGVGKFVDVFSEAARAVRSVADAVAVWPQLPSHARFEKVRITVRVPP